MEIHHGNIPIATLGVNLQQIWTFSPELQAIPIRTTAYRDFNGSRAARKQRAQAINFLDEEPLSAPRDISPRVESPVPIPIPPPVASSSRHEGLSSSGVPLDSIPRDIESHHEFVEEWASRLTIGEALRYGIGWEKVPGEEPCE